MGSDVKIARALISVTDKTGVVDFARTLVDDFGGDIISSGGTARDIEDTGVPVTPIEEFTGYPEMMDGRVKTLHPKVHGALLARRDSEQHMQEAAQHGIKLIDLVVVNLYEFDHRGVPQLGVQRQSQFQIPQAVAQKDQGIDAFALFHQHALNGGTSAVAVAQNQKLCHKRGPPLLPFT